MKRSNLTILNQLKGKTTGPVKVQDPMSIKSQFFDLVEKIGNDEKYTDSHRDRA